METISNDYAPPFVYSSWVVVSCQMKLCAPSTSLLHSVNLSRKIVVTVIRVSTDVNNSFDRKRKYTCFTFSEVLQLFMILS